MEDNPYAVLAGLADPPADSNVIMRVGIVTSVDPPAVAVGGITADGDMLRWNAALLAHEQRVTGPSGLLVLSGSGVSVSGGTLTEKVTPDVKNGDSVLTLSEDDQTFFVVCKVV